MDSRKPLISFNLVGEVTGLLNLSQANTITVAVNNTLNQTTVPQGNLNKIPFIAFTFCKDHPETRSIFLLG